MSKKMNIDINLGDIAKDSITSFTGVVTGDFRYLNGCRRLCLQPKELKDGKPIESHTFDVEQIELVERAAPRAVEPSGGPMPTPMRQADPTR